MRPGMRACAKWIALSLSTRIGCAPSRRAWRRHYPPPIRRAWRNRRKDRICERIALFAPRLGSRLPARVTIREQKTRWGSGSRKGNLNFNWKLIRAPQEALDYVVVHELCHLYEFNHSPGFWRMVESVLPDYGQWKRWLAQHGQNL